MRSANLISHDEDAFSKLLNDSKSEPMALFGDWLQQATQSEPNDPMAMAVASVDDEGMPNLRMVLMRGWDSDSIRFMTNLESAKGKEFLASKKGAALFHWKSLARQVRFRGRVEPIDEKVADDYFSTRPRGSQIAAWASAQSRALPSYQDFSASTRDIAHKFEGAEVPKPSYWSGFNILILSVEFWLNVDSRMHQRLLFSRDNIDERSWQKKLLYP